MRRRYTRQKEGYEHPLKGVSPYKERNDQIIKLADSGVYSLDDLGKMFDLSRERVRQIYLKWAGKKFTSYRMRKKILTQATKRRRENKLAFHCSECGKPVTKKEKSYGQKYCVECREEYKHNGRLLSVTLKCDYCSVLYHPYRSSYYVRKKKNLKHNFCCHKHYALHKSGKIFAKDGS